MFILAIVPGMPHIAFLSFTALLLFAAWKQGKRVHDAQPEVEIDAINEAISYDSTPAIDWNSIPLVEPIGLNLGYKLVTLVDSAKGSPLSQRIRGVRQVISENCGILLPEIRIRENFRLKPAQYAIHINGTRVATGEVHADKLMAIPGVELYGEIDGVLDTDPAYGMAIIWILPEQKAKALNLGYQVVDCASVVATHVNKVARHYLPELFNYDDITHLHQRLALQSPRLAEDLTQALNFSQLLRIYRQLLLEQVSLKDINTIAATLLESVVVTKDPILLTSDVRFALRRAIVSAINGERRQLSVYTLDNGLENLLLNALNHAQQSGKIALDSFPVDPNILTQLQNTMPMVYEQMKAQNRAPILLVTPQLRPIIARYGRLFAAGLQILSYNEIPDESELDVIGTVA